MLRPPMGNLAAVIVALPANDAGPCFINASLRGSMYFPEALPFSLATIWPVFVLSRQAQSILAQADSPTAPAKHS